MSLKIERINKELQKEISYILANEVKNPSIKYITITYCDTTSDLSYTKVYFTTLQDKFDTLNGLKSAKGFIRKTLADRIDIRHIPELEFIYDESIEYGARIEQKIKEINSKE